MGQQPKYVKCKLGYNFCNKQNLAQKNLQCKIKKCSFEYLFNLIPFQLIISKVIKFTEDQTNASWVTVNQCR